MFNSFRRWVAVRLGFGYSPQELIDNLFEAYWRGYYAHAGKSGEITANSGQAAASRRQRYEDEFRPYYL